MAFFGLFGNSENLYFPGCFSFAFPGKKIENYRRILKKIDVDFKLHKDRDFMCCGGFLDEAGYDKELRKIARENLEKLQKKGIKKIITNCPLCYNTLKNYKEMLPDWNIETEFIITTILSKLKENENIIKSYSTEPIAYYDSCYLARYAEIINEPREILRIFGYQIIELPKNKEETLCCGSCGGLMHTNKELADKIALNFIKMLQRKNIKKITTADPRAYDYLRENLEKLKISEEEIHVIEFSDLICDALNLN